jgi:hypothetical protein
MDIWDKKIKVIERMHVKQIKDFSDEELERVFSGFDLPEEECLAIVRRFINNGLTIEKLYSAYDISDSIIQDSEQLSMSDRESLDASFEERRAEIESLRLYSRGEKNIKPIDLTKFGSEYLFD